MEACWSALALLLREGKPSRASAQVPTLSVAASSSCALRTLPVAAELKRAFDNDALPVNDSCDGEEEQ